MTDAKITQLQKMGELKQRAFDRRGVRRGKSQDPGKLTHAQFNLFPTSSSASQGRGCGYDGGLVPATRRNCQIPGSVSSHVGR